MHLRFSRTAGLALMATLLVAGRAAAQESPRAEPPRATLSGTVVDAATGEALTGVKVEIDDLYRTVGTDEAGAFELRRVPAGRTYTVRFEQLGYEPLEKEVTVGETLSLGQVALRPAPIQLQALRATYDRLERRRNSLAVPVRVLDRADILATPGLDARRLVESRAGLTPGRCNLLPCYTIRGRPRGLAVFIDERPALGGISELETYRADELHTVEVYRSNAMVRVYTEWYMEMAASSKIRPAPLYIW